MLKKFKMNFPAKPLVTDRAVRLEILRRPHHHRNQAIHIYQHPRRPAAPHIMSIPTSRSLARCVCQFRSARSTIRPGTASLAQQRALRRWASTEASAATNPKIATIVDQISQLTLLETADLVSTLKVRLQFLVPTRNSTLRPNIGVQRYIIFEGTPSCESIADRGFLRHA